MTKMLFLSCVEIWGELQFWENWISKNLRVARWNLVEPFRAFSFPSTVCSLELHASALPSPCSSLSFHSSTRFPVGGHLSQVTSLRGRQPTAVRPLHAVFLPHQPAVPQASLSAHSPQVTCSCTRVLVPAGGRGPLSCTARLFPDLTCSQPPLPPPFLPAVGAPGSLLLKELLAWFFGPYPVTVLLFPDGRGQACILYYSLCFQTHVYCLCRLSSFCF